VLTSTTRTCAVARSRNTICQVFPRSRERRDRSSTRTVWKEQRGERVFGEEPPQVGALEMGAALRRVLEHAGDVEAASFRERATAAHLVVDGSGVLPIRRVAGVDRD
jgi:hypothetical protein